MASNRLFICFMRFVTWKRVKRLWLARISHPQTQYHQKQTFSQQDSAVYDKAQSEYSSQEPKPNPYNPL